MPAQNRLLQIGLTLECYICTKKFLHVLKCLTLFLIFFNLSNKMAPHIFTLLPYSSQSSTDK